MVKDGVGVDDRYRRYRRYRRYPLVDRYLQTYNPMSKSPIGASRWFASSMLFSLFPFLSVIVDLPQGEEVHLKFWKLGSYQHERFIS